MASFSNLSKTYAKDKLSKCATTILLMHCYLYLSVLDRTLLSYVRSILQPASVLASDRYYWRLFVEPLDWSVRSISSSVQSSVRSLLWARFFAILRTAWFLSLCLDFAWYLGSSLVLLGSCLWCWSSNHYVAFIQVTSCTLLNYKTITFKFISLIWLCWSSNTKIQSKWA